MQENSKIAPEIKEFLTEIEQEKTKPQRAKSTMSVREMASLLGIHKTDSYWLISKHFFKTVQISGKMRVDIKSFYKWYDNQIKYHIDGGRPPGCNLKKNSYSAADISEILGISEKYAYELIQEKGLPIITVDYWQRVPKKAFDKWYHSQSHFRNAEDRAKDEALEEATYTMPEMDRMLGISRNEVYAILRAKRNTGFFETIKIADRKRITKESFYRWLNSQDQYHVISQEEPCIKRYTDVDPDHYSVAEASKKYSIPLSRLYTWIREKKIPVNKTGYLTLIPKESFDEWIKNHEEEVSKWRRS